MAQVIEGGEFGVVFEGQELGDLLKLVEFAIVTTENVGVPVWELGEWKTALEEALTKPRGEEEVEELLGTRMEILPPEDVVQQHEDVCECGDMFWRHRKELVQGGESPMPVMVHFCSNRRGAFVREKAGGDNSAKAPVRGRRRDE